MRILLLIPTLIILSMTICSCGNNTKTSPELALGDELYGTWVYQGHTTDTNNLIYNRSTRFAENRSGFSIQPANDLTEHCVAGLCGSIPPYTKFKGSWQRTSENTLVMSYNHYDGQRTYEIEIIALSDDQLECRKTARR